MISSEVVIRTDADFIREELSKKVNATKTADVEGLEYTVKNNKLLIDAKLSNGSCFEIPKGITLFLSNCAKPFATVDHPNHYCISVQVENVDQPIVKFSSDCPEKFDSLKPERLKFLHYFPNENSEFHYLSKLKKFVPNSSAYYWLMLESISPFVKKMSNDKNPILIISSRNNIDDSLNRSSHDFQHALGLQVVLTHSSSINNERLCTATIQSIECTDKKVILTLATVNCGEIWEDTDLWLYPEQFHDKNMIVHTKEQEIVDDIDELDGVSLYINDDNDISEKTIDESSSIVSDYKNDLDKKVNAWNDNNRSNNEVNEENNHVMEQAINKEDERVGPIEELSESNFGAEEDTDAEHSSEGLMQIEEETDFNQIDIEEQEEQEEEGIEESLNSTIDSVLPDDVFAKVFGWKYIDGEFRRMRIKCGKKWKNQYQTVLYFQPVEKSMIYLLKTVKVGTCLRLSIDPDEPGEVTLLVYSTERKDVIRLEVLSVDNPDTKLLLSREETYYLQVEQQYINEEDYDDRLSEEGTIDGYELHENVDEMCEKIGRLALSEASIKTWLAAINIVHIRVAMSSERPQQTRNFRSLSGCYIEIYCEKQPQHALLALVSKVMNDVIIFTIKGVTQHGEMRICKEATYRIRNARSFMDRMNSLNDCEDNSLKHIFTTQQLLTQETTDIKFHRSFYNHRKEGTSKQIFSLFNIKSPVFQCIPNGTLVLIGKCWQVEGKFEGKANFLLAFKAKDPKIEKDVRDNTLVLEVKYTKRLFPVDDFNLTKAYYFLEIDDTRLIQSDRKWMLVDAKCMINQTYATQSDEFSDKCDFLVFTKRKLPKVREQKSQPVAQLSQEVKIVPLMEQHLCEINQTPIDSESSSEQVPKEENVVSECNMDLLVYKIERIDTINHKELCFVNMIVCGYDVVNDENTFFIVMEVSPRFATEKSRSADLLAMNNNNLLAFTMDHINTVINFFGKIEAIDGTEIKIRVDIHRPYTASFLKYWIDYLNCLKLDSMPMLCYEVLQISRPHS